jgi:hypothetical protein
VIAYQTDDLGRFVAEIECQPSPLEPGEFLVPRGAVTVQPPQVGENEFAVWGGESWSVEQIPSPEPSPEEEVTWEFIRAERDYLLHSSDWTQIADSSADSSAWASYRQELRDIPQSFDSPEDVVWPSTP